MTTLKFQNTSLLMLAIAIIMVVAGCKKENDSPTVTTQEKIDTVVDSVRLAVETEIDKIIPTLNVFIQTPEGSWFSSSAGQGYQSITADTWFRLASNTKTFTSTAILNMQEDGWLNIGDKITDTIPGSGIPYVPATVAWNIPYKGEITIKMLLQHSAGVYDVDNDSVPGCNGASYTSYMMALDQDHQFTAEEMVGQAALHQLSYFVPGTDHHYSNTGFVILSEIVGRIYSFRSGNQKHLTDYLYDKVYGPETPVPINIHFPYLATDQDMPAPFSCGHELYETGIMMEFCSFNMSAQVGEGNGYATMHDLNTFIRTLMKGQNVLTPASVHLMTTELSPGSSDYYLGCLFAPNLGYGHNGLRIGNISLMVYDPATDVSVVAYTSARDMADGVKTIIAVYDAAYATRSALGYPGKPGK
jgi:D-alanyl-D-alanine carboxypeptidase